MSTTCPRCGQLNLDGAGLCSGCSLPLIGMEETQPSSSAPARPLPPGPANGAVGGTGVATTLPQDSPAGAQTPPADSAEGGQVSGPEKSGLIGTMVGEYRVTGMLGQGGMGTVYSGVHPLIGKKVAVKVLKATLSEDRDAAERFLAEAKAVNAIGHPNIVDIFAFGNLADGSQYFVMEHLPGRTMREYLREHGCIQYRHALPVFSGVMEALGAAHEHGIVHRDLKPDNIFLANMPKKRLLAKLLDFGISKFAEGGFKTGITRTGTPIGTPLYMSPEQFQGVNVDHRSDIYSLGVVLYEAFTGRVPFFSEVFFAVFQMHTFQTPVRPSELADIPEDLENIILQCLAKDQQQRPQSVEHLSERLVPVLGRLSRTRKTRSPVVVKDPQAVASPASVPAAVSPPSMPAAGQSVTSPPGGLPKARSRKAVVVAASTGVAVAVALGVGLALWLREPSQPRPSASRQTSPQALAKKTPAPLTDRPPPGKTDQATIQFVVTPRGSRHEIWVDGKKLDRPMVTVPASDKKTLKVKVVAEGYETYTAEFSPVSSTTFPVQLKHAEDSKIRSRTGRKRRSRRAAARQATRSAHPALKTAPPAGRPARPPRRVKMIEDVGGLEKKP